jgi:hypothetical protein
VLFGHWSNGGAMVYRPLRAIRQDSPKRVMRAS